MRTRQVLGETETVIAVTLPGGIALEGELGSDRRVARVTTWMPNAILGDIALEAVYSGYQDFDGVSVPTRIVQRQAGFPLLDIHVTGVEINAVAPLSVPEAIRRQAPPARFVSSPEQLAPGVWNIPLGSRDRSVVVEFSDYLVVFDTPVERAGVTEVGLEAIRRQWPNTPIRYVINTHTHFDHAAGLRAYAAEGATVITHESNVGYYQQAWSNPRSLAPDRLARSSRTPAFEGVVGSRTLTDGRRQLEIHHYPGNMHHPGLLLAYLPAERMLLQADSFNPASAYGGRPPAMPNLLHFYAAIERLKLDVEHIVPVHGRITTMDELRLVIDRYGG